MTNISLFVYGTLMYPMLFREITGEAPVYEPAQLKGFAVRRLVQRTYPGLVEESAALAPGLLLRNLPAGIMEILDEYEGEEYELRAVSIEVEGGSIAGFTYALKTAFSALATPEIWEPDQRQISPVFAQVRN